MNLAKKILAAGSLFMMLTAPVAAYANPVQMSPREDVPVVSVTASAYSNVAISRVNNYVNVRTEPNTSSEIVGKIYNNCAATILATVNGEGGKWYQIQSGTVNGYIKAEYFITGSEAERIASEIGTVYATINTTTLRLREEASTNSRTLTLLSRDAQYIAVGEEGDFVKIEVDDSLTGYVHKDYIQEYVEFDSAVSLEEEQQRLEETERVKKEAEDAIAALNQIKATVSQAAPSDPAASAETTAPAETAAPAENAAPAETAAPAENAAPTETTASAETIAPSGSTETIAPQGATAQVDTVAPSVAAPVETAAPPDAAPAEAAAPSGAMQGESSAPSGVITVNPNSAGQQDVTTSAPVGNTAGPGSTGGPTGSVSNTESPAGPGAPAQSNTAPSGVGNAELTSATRTAIVAYAKQFLANPYVFGGTSLTNGADCSGFVMRIFEHFGIDTGRSSRDQAAKGKKIPISDIQPGDLLFYASGDYINHVAIYIGGGQIIHASNSKTGIIISTAYYRTPYQAATFLN